MSYKSGNDRNQIMLLPEAIGDYISENNPVQVIDAFVENLNKDKFNFKYQKTQSTGRPPFNPFDLLKLFLYGYINSLRSSRKLEKECHRNLEVIWLLKGLKPDHKTIANFRNVNKEELPKVLSEFILLCKGLSLLGGELVSIDGSKFKAVNNRSKNVVKEKAEARIKEIEQQINTYLEQLDENDKKEETMKEPTREEILEKIKVIKARKARYENLKAKMEETGENQISEVDPDSRLMRNNHKMDVCYNVQTAVDEKNKLIIDYEVTNEACDINQLGNMAIKAQKTLGKENIDILADKGYFNTTDIKKCIDAGMSPYVSKPETTGPKNSFKLEEFKYIKEKDVYLCPGNQELIFKKLRKDKKRVTRVYTTGACKNCELRKQCSKNIRGREIYRWEHEEIIEDMENRLKNEPEKYFKRRCLSEHPFGTIKRSMNAGFLLVKGFEKVKAEISIIILSYNLKRVINIMGVKKMREILG